MGKIKKIPYKGTELLSAKTDLVFKALMTADGDLELLASLLSSVLDLNINAGDITINNTELTRTGEKDKPASIDVRVRLADGKAINIEIQVDTEKCMAARSVFYLSKLYVEQIAIGMEYDLICPAIAINILDFNYLPFAEYHNKYRLKNVRNNCKLTDVFEVNFLELKKAPKEPGCLKELWMLFLAAESEVELEMLSKESPVMEKAVNRLIYFSADEQLRYDLDMREKWVLDHASREAAKLREGIAKGRAEGKAEGLAQGLEETAVKMLNENVDIPFIAKITGLPVDRIARLKEQHDL